MDEGGANGRDEIDYLAGIGSEPREEGYADLVLDAFRRECGCDGVAAIAERLGKTKGWASQCVNHPRIVKERRLETLIAPLSPNARGRIVAAWRRESATVVGREPVGAREEAAYVQQLVREDRPDLALEVATKALQGDPDPDARKVLLGHATEILLRLDRPGEAMRLAGQLAEVAEEGGDREALALATALAARAARQARMPARRVVELRELARSRLAAVDRSPGNPRARIAANARDLLESEDVTSVVEAHRSGDGGEAEIRRMLEIAQDRARRAPSGRSAARASHLEALARLELGDLFGAEEALGRAYQQGGANLSAGVRLGPVYGRVLEARGRIEEAVLFYRRLCVASERRRELHVYRLAQVELARLLAP